MKTESKTAIMSFDTDCRRVSTVDPPGLRWSDEVAFNHPLPQMVLT